MLKTTIASLPQVFICIDGLDECLPGNRRDLLESLQDIVQASPTIRVFLSGRPHVKDEIKGYFTEAIMILVVPTIEDIKRYLNMRIEKDTTPNAMNDNLRAEIMRVILEKISRIFILVSLNIDAVLEEVTIHKRKERLNEMIQGNGLRDAYSATLSRIKAQGRSKSRLGMDMLMWLSHSERPLNTNELCDALGVEIGSKDLNSQNIPAIEILLGCSLGLVVVEASSYAVRLVHYTLKEYLSNNADLFPSPHATIAQVCLTYLNFQCIRDLPPTLRQSPPTTPFLGYASCYWGIHARRNFTESVNELALGLLDGFDKHVSSGILLSLHHDNWDRSLVRCNPTGFTGLHGAAYLGMAEAAAGLLEMKKWDLGTTGVGGNTAISWAVKRGLKAMVKMLLTREDASPNTADRDGQTPLHRAVVDKSTDIVNMLLERNDLTPNTANKDGETPLHRAVINNSTDIVKMLLKRRDVSPNISDKYSQTPLSWAARNGNDNLVRMLLGRKDIIPDIADKDGRTPLAWGVIFGHGGAVKMLLGQKDIIPDTADKDGRTTLSWAAANGCDAILMMLLEREDVAPDHADKNGRTPLAWAVVRGHGGVVKILLEREDVTPGSADKDGSTPLSWAVGLGNAGIVKMLLEQRGVTLETLHKNGQKLLSWAAGYGHIRIAEMLRERCSFSQDMLTTDPAGQAALTQAPGKRLRGDQGPVPQSADSNSSIDLVPAGPSEPSLRPSKRIRRS